MRHKVIFRSGTNRLILVYAGWGMDWRPFAGLKHPSYDIIVVWDYTELTFDWSKFFRYDEICLIAWSMGVFAASLTIHEIEPRITMRIAVNGTLHPIDDHRGIPPAIWHGTHNALSPSTWWKFQRRMCTSAAQYSEFAAVAPHRTIQSLRDELYALETHTIFHVEQVEDWDMAIVGMRDGIFPAANQLNAWRGLTTVRTLDTGHLPDFGQIITRLVIDKDRVSHRFDTARSTYTRSASVQRSIAEELMERFDRIFGKGPIVGNVIEIGPGVDMPLTRKWIGRTDPRAKIRLWDIAEINAEGIPSNTVVERCDAEVRIKRQPGESVGFIFSSSTVQWFNSPREFIKECERVLVPGGFLVLSSFVAGNLEELTAITGNGLQLPTQRGWQTMLPTTMTALVVETELKTMYFDSSRAVLEHLRDTGVNAVRFGQSSTVLARRVLRELTPDAEGQYSLTYRPIFIVARKDTEV